MEHVKMSNIEDIYRLPKKAKEYLIYKKPIGVDIFVVDGVIYDFDHNEIVNKELRFTLEKLLTTTVQTQGLYIGTLCTIIDPDEIFRIAPLLYMEDGTLPLTIRFMVYDIIFPRFKVENPFRIRYDIAKKTTEKLQGCSCFDLVTLNNYKEFKDLVWDTFTNKRNDKLIVFDKDGEYHCGERQSTYSINEQVSFEISPDQKYRGHIKRILPIDIEKEENKTTKIAGVVQARFKGKVLDIPIKHQSYILKKNLWEHRKELKNQPFFFNGLYYEFPEENEYEILGLRYSNLIV